MLACLTYEGYTLYGRDLGGYRSYIDGESVNFDTVSQWVQFINYLENGKRKETADRGK